MCSKATCAWKLLNSQSWTEQAQADLVTAALVLGSQSFPLGAASLPWCSSAEVQLSCPLGSWWSALLLVTLCSLVWTPCRFYHDLFLWSKSWGRKQSASKMTVKATWEMCTGQPLQRKKQAYSRGCGNGEFWVLFAKSRLNCICQLQWQWRKRRKD